ncbi:MAG: ABC transporter ATP-binding protein [Planctomycetes bacterium]|nr:ABC transporter ATP-binding protein [Planctomycetota bacterium]
MISVQGIGLKQGAFALHDVSFDVESGAYGVLMGRSGTGKTSLLEAVCGLRAIAAGRVIVGGEDVTGRKPAERGIGYVPQDGALFMTMNVRDNLAFALHVRRWTSVQITSRVDELAGLLGLGDLLDRDPAGLSGGETQRVALGRALAYHPHVLCLDEPFSALDDETRSEMYELMRSVRAATGCTALHVTHNLREAENLADVILRIDGGAVAAEAMA